MAGVSTLCQGFWDMMCYQIEGLYKEFQCLGGQWLATIKNAWDMVFDQNDSLYKTFQTLTDMEGSGWTMLPPSPRKPKIQVCLVHTYTECQVGTL